MTEPNAASLGSPRRILPKAFGVPTIVVLILFFLALLFPWDSLTRRVAYEISAASGSQVSIESLAPALTGRGPVLRARDVVIRHPAVERVGLSELEIAPRWSTRWFAGEPLLRVWADSELGLVDGVLGLGETPIFVGQVSRVELAKLPLRLDASGFRLSGQLDADTDVALNRNGTLQGRIEFESPSLIVESAALPIAIPFSQVDGVIVILENGATQIESMSLSGEMIEGQLSGEIGLAHPSQSPPIDLIADLRIVDPMLRQLAPSAGLPISQNGKLAVRLRGTFDEPQIENRAGARPGQGPGRNRAEQKRN